MFQCVEPRTFALTIDDGPSTVTPAMLTALRGAGVKVSFFLLGSMIDARPAVLAQEVSRKVLTQPPLRTGHPLSH